MSPVAEIQAMLNRGVEEGVFPGGVFLAAVGGTPQAVLVSGRLEYRPDSPPARTGTVYDLASVTKILSTTVLVMLLCDRGLLDLNAPLADLLPSLVPADKARLTPALLLGHASGLPAWRPLYRDLEKLPPGERRDAALARVLAEPLEAPPGRVPIYSDLNFILLGLIVEAITGRRQDECFRTEIAEPLKLARAGYRAADVFHNDPPDGIAPTETGPRRSGPVDGPDGDPRPGVPVGWVHDDNAAALGGVAGHAGLFGTAGDVWLIIDDLARSYRGKPGRLVQPDTVRRFWRPSNLAKGSTYALGFDMPSAVGASAGTRFSRRSVGHLGFTGASAWHDPEADFTVILLTNRVHPHAENQKIKEFRPPLHDAAYRVFLF